MMETFVVYLLKTGMWIGIFWLIYRLFLRKETFYRFNRYYLLAGLILPFIIPCMQLRYTVEMAMPVTSGMPVGPADNLSAHAFDWTFVWLMVYGCGIVALVVRYLAGLRKIAVLIASQPARKTGSFHVVDSPGFRHPFSVFNYIFVNSRATSDVAQDMILEHEQAHILQRHWIDLAICNLACILQWFNPFAWLYIKAMKQNHEYLADQSVLQNGHSPAVYQAVLLSYTLNVNASALVHSFAHTGKASRFRMMKKAASNPLRKGAVLLAFPVLAVFLWAFAQPVYISGTRTAPPNSPIATADTISIRGKVTGNAPVKETGKPEPQTTRQSAKPEPVSAGPATSITATAIEADPPLVLMDGKEVPSSMLKTMDTNTIESISVLKDESATSMYGEKGKNGVISIQTKAQADRTVAH